MKTEVTQRRLQREEIVQQLRQDPQALIQEEDARYHAELLAVTERLCDGMTGRRLVLLSGPSASGKTTTALKLEQLLQQRGVEACTVSLDNFYRGYGQAPRLPDGSFDYETVEALDIPRLKTCMRELVSEGETRLPVFDFLTHAPKAESVPLRVTDNAVIIFEGIHALNPLLREQLPEEALFRLFINVMSPVYDGEDKWLARRDLRLVRRLIRDVRFRDSTLENTMDMWKQVMRGETLYLFPYADTADMQFDTMHAYEPAMLGAQLLPLLQAVPATSRHAETVQHLIRALSAFEPLSEKRLPADALLREFIG